MDTCDNVFSSESDNELLAATQIAENQFNLEQFVDDGDVGVDPVQTTQQFQQTTAATALYEDISDEELLTATQEIERRHVQPTTSGKNATALYEDISDDELLSETQKIERRHVLPSTSRDGTSTRFKSPLSEETIQHMGYERVPRATRDKALWAVTLFGEWRAHRNMRAVNHPEMNLIYLNKPLMQMNTHEINQSVTRFLTEVRKADGSDYPGQTLREMVSSIQKQFEMNGRVIKLFSDPHFKLLQDTLDFIMKQRASLGIGTSKKQADVITEEQEDVLWSKGILGDHSPQALLDTQVYMFGLNFALRGGQEHRNLKPSQIKLLETATGENYLQYTEDVSKTNSGGLHGRCGRKVTQAFENKTNPARCPVRLYKMYNSKCPENRPDDCYYLRPRSLAKDNPKSYEVWYTSAPVGKHLLAKVVSSLCARAGFSGYYTNHSLRATAATRLYDAGIDEQLICEKTGHRSNAVRSYKRTSTEQKQGVSRIVQGCKKLKNDSGSATTDDSRNINVTINLQIK